jgi:hypothetical protein
MKRQLNVLLIIFAAANLFLLNNIQAQDAKSQVYSVEEIIEKAPTLVGQTVSVKGNVQHICERSGRKLFLETTDGKRTFRFNAGKKIDKFDENAIERTVIATGIVAEQRVTIEDLNNQEAAAIAAEKAQKAKKTAEHCTSEAKANGENTSATPLQRVQALKAKLNKQIEAGKKNYLSFYTIDDTNEYSIVK